MHHRLELEDRLPVVPGPGRAQRHAYLQPVADLEFALGQLAVERITEGQWQVVAIDGEAALRPIEPFLLEQHGIESAKGYGIVLVKLKELK